MSGANGVFTFRLQRVLELREKKEQAMATALTRAQSEADQAREARDRLHVVRHESAAQLALAPPAPERTAGHLQQLGALLEFLDRHIAVASTAATAAEQNVQQAQVELTAAFRERRVLDRLRERQHEAWRTGTAHLDRQLMDDLALARFVRPNGSSTNEDR